MESVESNAAKPFGKQNSIDSGKEFLDTRW